MVGSIPVEVKRKKMRRRMASREAVRAGVRPGQSVMDGGYRAVKGC